MRMRELQHVLTAQALWLSTVYLVQATLQAMSLYDYIGHL
jgi:hypothetical protein